MKQYEVYKTVVNGRTVAATVERYEYELIQDAVFDTLQEAGIRFKAEGFVEDTPEYHIIGTRYVLEVE
jgi:hypothetical protein